MDEINKNEVSKDPYKGVRDFYPEDMAVQNYIFDAMRKTAELFGYVEYNASVLEPTELYTAKSGQEIVSEQTYSFKDRGDRDVTLRPEMTPTVARMVAARKRELGFPLRWYSIPNLFRYEKPQRGRLREHFQLNVDIFGVETLDAERELITLGSALMARLGATSEMFVIKVNNRKILSYLFEYVFKLSKNQSADLTRLVDKKNKMDAEKFAGEAEKIFGGVAKDAAAKSQITKSFLEIMASESIDSFSAAISAAITKKISADSGLDETKELIENLKKSGITNVRFDPTLARGFDYYTGIVFEFFDTDPANSRSLFGGGRYDDLLSIFGSDKVPAAGFGLGDVTLRDFLETHGILPTYAPPTNIYLCHIGERAQTFIGTTAESLRQQGLNVAVDFTDRKIADQIRTADKQKIPWIMVIGDDEAASGELTLKNLSSGDEHSFKDTRQIADFIKSQRRAVASKRTETRHDPAESDVSAA